MKLLADSLASANYAVFQDDSFDGLRACWRAIMSASRATKSFVGRNESLVKRYQVDSNPVQFLWFPRVRIRPETARGFEKARHSGESLLLLRDHACPKPFLRITYSCSLNNSTSVSSSAPAIAPRIFCNDGSPCAERHMFSFNWRMVALSQGILLRSSLTVSG